MMRQFLSILLSIVATIFISGCENIRVVVITSDAYLNTTEVKGENKNCAVVLRAQQGTSYSITITSENNWAKFSGGNTTIEGTMQNTDKVIYIYFDKNASGESRVADVAVSFSDGRRFDLSFTQHSYDNTIAVTRAWAELPVCKEENNYIYNTHFGSMGLRNDSLNYTYFFYP